MHRKRTNASGARALGVWAFAVLTLASASGCNEGRELESASLLDRGAGFIESRQARRDALESSIVDPTNSYSTRRLRFYAVDSSESPTSWEAREVWNPAVRRVSVSGEGLAYEAHTMPLEWTHDALMTLGERAFAQYPVQPSDSVEAYIEDADAWGLAGLEVDRNGGLGGLVDVQNANGTTSVALTCATCHSTVLENGRRVPGAPGVFNYGEVLAATAPAEAANVLRQWGDGRVDVTPTAFDPVAISDLRPIRYQTHLHWAATLKNDLLALAVRVDTLIIDSIGGQRRPPRELSFALAYYLWHLDAAAMNANAASPEIERGRTLFDQRCAGCHGDGRTPNGPVPLDALGIESATGTSADRGTGFWRVPSLWGVSTRPHLLHDASVAGLDELLDPERLRERPGHDFGTDLPADEREALVAFLETLGDPAPPAD